jgi:aminoglycoside N3'-acetyltransferase
MIVEGHERCDTPCGAGSPYERLVMMEASVLMFGASMQAYTLFHTAEDAAMVPYLYQSLPVTLRYRAADGSEQTMTMRRHDMHVARSFAARGAWLEEQGLLRRVALGRGELLFIRDARSAHAALVNQLRLHPQFLLAAAAA